MLDFSESKATEMCDDRPTWPEMSHNYLNVYTTAK